MTCPAPVTLDRDTFECQIATAIYLIFQQHAPAGVGTVFWTGLEAELTVALSNSLAAA